MRYIFSMEEEEVFLVVLFLGALIEMKTTKWNLNVVIFNPDFLNYYK